MSFIPTPLPLLVVLAFITGVMSILMGLIAEIIMRTYYESQGKQVYLVKDTINLSGDTLDVRHRRIRRRGGRTATSGR